MCKPKIVQVKYSIFEKVYIRSEVSISFFKPNSISIPFFDITNNIILFREKKHKNNPSSSSLSNGFLTLKNLAFAKHDH